MTWHRPRPASRVIGATVLLTGSLALPGGAQPKPKGSVGGTVRSATGDPIGDALLRLSRDSAVYLARSDVDGRYLIPAVDSGRFTVVAKRLGFDSSVTTINVLEARVRVDAVLHAHPLPFDTVRVRASFVGVSGVVGDFARMAPMAGSTVRVFGAPGGVPAAVSSDSAGRFAIELPPTRSYAVRVERAGFAAQLTSVFIQPGQRIELAVLLDSATRAPNDAWKWSELEQRQRDNTYGSARVSRAELQSINIANLQFALQKAPSVVERGLTIPRRPCVFVDGVARPALAVDAITIEQIEFVEIYANNADRSRTLTARWPTGVVCGGREFTDRTVTTATRGASNEAQYVVIWTRGAM